MSLELAGIGMIGLTRDALLALRSVLFRETGSNAAAYLQEAGYTGGRAMHKAFAAWCAAKGHALPEHMSAPEFEARATEFFSELGWGAVRVGLLHDAVITVDSANWAESDPASAMQFPGCYLSAGMLADFFGRVGGGDAQVAAMEVECRSMGSERCRFLLGSVETIQQIYDGMVQGNSYEAAIQPTA